MKRKLHLTPSSLSLSLPQEIARIDDRFWRGSSKKGVKERLAA
jgi:hypothetical protein